MAATATQWMGRVPLYLYNIYIVYLHVTYKHMYIHIVHIYIYTYMNICIDIVTYTVTGFKQFRQWLVNDTRQHARWSTEVIVERATEARENDHERS